MRTRYAIILLVLLAVGLGVVISLSGSRSPNSTVTAPLPRSMYNRLPKLPTSPPTLQKRPTAMIPAKPVALTNQRFGSAAVPIVGEVLSTTNGTWTNAPTSYTYQWQRCNSSGASCTNISGATSSAYTIVLADVASTLRSAVTAHNSVGTATSDSAVTGVVTSSSGGNVALFNISNDADTTTTTQAKNFNIVQMQYNGPSTKSLVDTLHSAVPGIQVYMYADPTNFGGFTSGSPSNGCVNSNTGGNSWSLYNGTTSLGSPNPGTSGFDSACVSNAMTQAKSADFDGVFWDEINSIPTYKFSGSTCINAFGGGSCSLFSGGSDTAWINNWTPFLTAVQSGDSSNSLKSILNIGGGWANQSTWQAWNGYVQGAMEESFVGTYQDTLVDYSQWLPEIQDETWSEANGKIFMAINYDASQTCSGANAGTGSTREAQDRYGLASMLLAANGKSTFDSTNPNGLNCASFEFWPEYTSAQSLGAPSGAYTSFTSGSATVYERHFANGLVIVNPTSSGSSSVSLGATYSGSGSEPTNISSLTLPAQSGYILIGP